MPNAQFLFENQWHSSLDFPLYLQTSLSCLSLGDGPSRLRVIAFSQKLCCEMVKSHWLSGSYISPQNFQQELYTSCTRVRSTCETQLTAARHRALLLMNVAQIIINNVVRLAAIRSTEACSCKAQPSLQAYCPISIIIST